MTYRYLAYSILEMVKQTIDDREISLSLVVYWLQVVANRLRYQKIKKEMTGMFLEEFLCTTINVSKEECRPIGQKYFDLPKEIYDLPKDGGIDHIYYYPDGCVDPVSFSRSSFSELHRLFMEEYERPSPENPYFYLVENKVRLLGVDCVDLKKLIVGLYTTISVDSVCDLDSKFPASPEQEELIIYRVLDLLKFSFVTNKDRKNDGSDMTREINDPSVITNQRTVREDEQQAPQQ